MDMSKAALPPIQPAIRDQDRSHPLFPLYQQHRNFCAQQLIEASRFEDWLFQYERNQENEKAAQHPRYQAFLDWCRATKSGARRCPAGSFPHNFHFWLEGGRW